MHEQKILRRITSANLPHHVMISELDTSHVGKDGHGTVIVGMESHGKSCFQQVYINPLLAKALVSGKPNKNLDNLLRL